MRSALPLLLAALVLVQAPRALSAAPSWDALAFIGNARCMAGDCPYYEWVREPGMPALLAAALPVCGGGPEAAGACALALLLLPVSASAALARRAGGEGAGLLAAALFGLSPLALAHGGQAASDVACAGLAAAALVAWRRQGRLACALAAAAVLFRYPAAVLCIALARRRTLVPLALALAVAVLPWMWAGQERFGDPLLPVRVKLVQQQRMEAGPAWFYLARALPALGPAAAAALLSRRRGAVAAFVALALALLTVNANKEERYLLLLAPAALAMAAEGAQRLGRAPALALLAAQAAWGMPLLWAAAPGELARVEAAAMLADERPGVVLSDVWVPLSYYGRFPARWLPDEEHLDDVAARYGATRVAVSDRAWEPPYATEEFMGAKGYAFDFAVERGGERVAVFRTGVPAGNVTRVENRFDVNG